MKVAMTDTRKGVLGWAAVFPLMLKKFFLLLASYVPWFNYAHVSDLDNVTSKFVGNFHQGGGKSKDKRRSEYTKTTETFYNLITDFYEYGWGQSFHFAPANKGESFADSIVRYEQLFAEKLSVGKGVHCMDVGCGIGGPMRTIAKHSGCKITGINITQEHIERAQKFNARAGVSEQCNFIRSDFNKIPVDKHAFDCAYDFEAILHSTHRETTFREVHRVLKPDALFITAQYCLLDAYDPENAEHVDIIRRVDNTNGCYVAGNTVASTREDLEKAGFEVLEAWNQFDAKHSDIPFHEVFKSQRGGRFAGTALGRMCTSAFTYVGETLRLLPKGTHEVQRMLVGAAESFKEAGEANILTPGYVFLCRRSTQDN
jgi:sterol 24-C-methyltransferase